MRNSRFVFIRGFAGTGSAFIRGGIKISTRGAAAAETGGQ